jgi:DNA-binding winged helix-turn-helix (wHTH) protein
MSTEMIGMHSLAARAIPEPKLEDTRRYLGFGNFTVDLKREELFKDGVRVKLPGKVYQTLVALLDRPGEVVSREDLRGRLWPEGTHVNYDANVNTTVNKLRLALGDSPEKPMYVETIPRQGYSFVGVVSTVSSSAAFRNGKGHAAEMESANAEASAEMLLARPDTLRGSSWFVAGIVALLLAGMLFGAATVMYLHRTI